jgi:hypothetical protein
VDRAAARRGPDPLFRAAAPPGLCAYPLDRVRSDAAEDRSLLARATVEALLREAGLGEIKLSWVNEMSWSAIGAKPAPAAIPDAASRS